MQAMKKQSKKKKETKDLPDYEQHLPGGAIDSITINIIGWNWNFFPISSLIKRDDGTHFSFVKKSSRTCGVTHVCYENTSHPVHFVDISKPLRCVEAKIKQSIASTVATQAN